MDEDEIRKSAALEERHWWYAGRRALIRRLLRGIPAGRALDVGAGSGGNSQVLAELGWEVTAIEASPVAVGLARSRGLRVLRGDARSLPFADEQFDLVMSTDMWEHVEEDDRVAAEAFRVCRPGGRLLLTVPAGKELWSGHDVALGHVRRYERAELVALVEGAGFGVTDTLGWNVLLRPVARAKRRTNTSESEMAQINPALNLVLRNVVRIESVLPVQRFRGISLVLRGYRPTR